MAEKLKIGDRVRMRKKSMGVHHSVVRSLNLARKDSSFNEFRVSNIQTHCTIAREGGRNQCCVSDCRCPGYLSLTQVKTGKKYNTCCFGYADGFALERTNKAFHKKLKEHHAEDIVLNSHASDRTDLDLPFHYRWHGVG